MTAEAPRDRASRWIAAVLRARFAVLAVYGLLVPAAALVAMRIPNEGAIERLIVPGDPDYVATRAFQQIFPEQPLVLLVFEAQDPWSAEALARIQRAREALATIPHVTTFWLGDSLARARPGATREQLRQLARGTAFFHRQGLVGDHYLTLVATLATHTAPERDAALAGIRTALAGAQVGDYHAVGAPVVTSWIEHESSAATSRSFVLFGVLLVVVTWFLYRSVRALLAILLALGAAVALALAVGGLLGFAFTIVSSLVPLTVMVTTLATLTYLHSRFIDQPPDLQLAEHHVCALRNKLLPITASTIAAASGFAALAISNIRPVRQMGLWTALGLVLAWVVSYTLFPALQAVLRTPTGQRVEVRSRGYERLVEVLPAFTRRYRYVLVAVALAGCIAGVIAIAGAPIRVDALSNIDPHSRVYRDMKWFRAHVMDLNVARVWIHLPRADATDPRVLHAIDRFTTALDALPHISGVAGPTSPLRLRSYFAGHGDRLPDNEDAFADAVGDVEELMLRQPELRTFIDVNHLTDIQLTVLFRDGGVNGYRTVARQIEDAWRATAGAALPGVQMRVVGESMLSAKVGANLVPTLTHSLALTVVLILAVFVVVFRSMTERLLALIPSAFALLVTFVGMRVAGASLNVATIIIATTVLGTTENDQLHFFHHMHERDGAPLAQRLHHAYRVAGRAILFATIINSVGFLGLATSRFPPLRQFGVMTAAAFVLAMFADFLLLPAALWLAFDRKPKVTAVCKS